MPPPSPRFAFFGTPQIAVTALEVLKKRGLVPTLIVTNPDAPVGRKQVMTPPPVKQWATVNQIPVIQPQTLKNADALKDLTTSSFDFFVVFAYGKIIPATLLALPQFGTINAHPSLLPKLRGASPIRSTLLTDLSACGVTIILMDEELDHGQIIRQEAVPLPSPIPGLELDTQLATLCGELLADTLLTNPQNGLAATPQDHTAATWCTKITKDMAEIKIDPLALPQGAEAYETYRKICAFDGWPEAFFIYENKRVKVKASSLTSIGQLCIERVVPEGKGEMTFAQYCAMLTQ